MTSVKATVDQTGRGKKRCDFISNNGSVAHLRMCVGSLHRTQYNQSGPLWAYLSVCNQTHVVIDIVKSIVDENERRSKGCIFILHCGSAAQLGISAGCL
jgi:hypothetical protein